MTHSLLLCAAALLYAPPVRADDRTCEATPYAVLAVAELEAQCGAAGVDCWTSGVVSRLVDADADGDLDILACWGNICKFAVSDGAAPPSFSIRAPSEHENAFSEITTTSDGVTSAVAADLGGDGVVEVVVASSTDGKIAELYYDDDTWNNAILHQVDDSEPTSVFAGDVDGDGDVDVTVRISRAALAATLARDGLGAALALTALFREFSLVAAVMLVVQVADLAKVLYTRALRAFGAEAASRGKRAVRALSKLSPRRSLAFFAPSPRKVAEREPGDAAKARELELNPIRKRSSTPTANEAALRAGSERHGVRLYDAAGQRRAKSVLETSRRSSVASPAASAARKERSARPRAASAAPKTARFADDAPASPAPTWTTHLDDQGAEYFYNTATGETRWTDPASPTEWVIHHTDDGAPYLYSTRTGETKWSEHAASPTAAPPGAERKEDDGAPDGGGGEAPEPAEEVEDGEAPVDGGGEAPPVEDAALVDVPLEVASDAVP